jgi:hypothetical protein
MIDVRGHPHGWHAHHIAQYKPVFGIDAALVDPDFPATQNPVDMAFGYTLTDTQQKIIDPLTGSTVVYLYHRDLVACDLFLGNFA